VWSQAEIDALTVAACAIGAAIHRREMEQAARTRAAELGRSNAVLSTRQRMLEAAVETSDALLAAIDVEAAIGGVLARLGVVLDADRALLIRFDPRPRQRAGVGRRAARVDRAGHRPPVRRPRAGSNEHRPVRRSL
jgi:hypothetical protein